MQVVVELLTAMVIWAAGLVVAQFGIEMDLKRPEPQRERVIERVTPERPTRIASECPEAKSAVLPRASAVSSPVARPA